LPVTAHHRLQPGTLAALGDKQLTCHRRQHHAKHALMVVDKRNVDREFAVALDEFAGAIEWIDQPVARP
jgi:hypothetical protein